MDAHFIVCIVHALATTTTTQLIYSCHTIVDISKRFSTWTWEASTVLTVVDFYFSTYFLVLIMLTLLPLSACNPHFCVFYLFIGI